MDVTRNGSNYWQLIGCWYVPQSQPFTQITNRCRTKTYQVHLIHT